MEANDGWSWARALDTMTASPMVKPKGSMVPPRIGRVLLIVCWLAVVYGMAAVVPHLPSARGIVAWVSTLLFLGSITLAVERPSTDILIPVSGLAAVVMQACAPNSGAFVAVVAAIAVAGIRLTSPWSRMVPLATSGGFLVASSLSPHPLSSTDVLAMLPALLFTYLGVTAVRRLRAEQHRSEALLTEAIAGRDAMIRAAALDERAHLAREIHDVLAHTLSALSLQLEGTRMLAEQRACDPMVVAALERTSRLAKQGLGEARRAVGSLRGEELPGPDLLPQLAREFEDDTGVPCQLHVEGEPGDLAADTRLALFRIAQEALTNVRKHADAVRVDLTLRYGAEGVELAVENDGVARASPLPGGGYGVSGMRERAALLHGSLEAGPTAQGFSVRLWIPTNSQSVS